MVYGEVDIRYVSLKGLDATFRNVVQDFDANRYDVGEVCTTSSWELNG